jgi:PPIC-type PPIASE domain
LLRRWLREPLLHFLLLGLAIFGAYRSLGPDQQPQSVIVVTEGIINGQIESFSRTWLRPPTPQEIDGLIREYVREEVYYREGMALGLDRDDSVIRRRLKQKLEFVAEAAGMATGPTDDDLRAYLAAHPDSYRTDVRVSFVHVFLSADRRGDAVAQDAARLLADLQSSTRSIDPAAFGDPTLLEHRLEDVLLRDVAAQFGDGFADRVAELPVGEWRGPIESGYGMHLVLVDAKTEGRTLELDEVRDALRRDWLNEQRIAANEKYYQSLLQRYTVTIEGRGPESLGRPPRSPAE